MDRFILLSSSKNRVKGAGLVHTLPLHACTFVRECVQHAPSLVALQPVRHLRAVANMRAGGTACAFNASPPPATTYPRGKTPPPPPSISHYRRPLVPRTVPPVPVDENPAVPEGSTPDKTETETEIEVDVKQPVEEEQPQAYADVAAPTNDYSSESTSEEDGIAAPPSESPSRAEEEVKAVEAVTEPVDAVIEPTAVVQAVNTAATAAADVVSDETAAAAAGEWRERCWLAMDGLSFLQLACGFDGDDVSATHRAWVGYCRKNKAGGRSVRIDSKMRSCHIFACVAWKRIGR